MECTYENRINYERRERKRVEGGEETYPLTSKPARGFTYGRTRQ